MFIYHLTNDELLDPKSILEKKYEKYTEIAKKLNCTILDESDEQEAKKQRVIHDLLKPKFHTLVRSLFPNVYKTQCKMTLSPMGLAFFSKHILHIQDKLQLMLILDNEVLPIYLSGSVVKNIPDKQRQGYKYVVNFNQASDQLQSLLEIQAEDLAKSNAV